MVYTTDSNGFFSGNHYDMHEVFLFSLVRCDATDVVRNKILCNNEMICHFFWLHI